MFRKNYWLKTNGEIKEISEEEWWEKRKQKSGHEQNFTLAMEYVSEWVFSKGSEAVILKKAQLNKLLSVGSLQESANEDSS